MEMLEGVWVRIAGGMQNLVYALLASVEEMIEIIALLLLIHTLLTYILHYCQENLAIEFNISEKTLKG